VRRPIKGFSHRARRALLNRVNSIDQHQAQPGHFAFITLTYDKDYPTAAASKIDLDRFMKRMEREHGPQWAIWKLEPQIRGAPHYHLLVYVGGSFDAGKLCDWVARAWHDLVGNNNPDHLKFHLGLLGNLPCVEQVRDWQGVANYAGKYLGKLSEGDEEWQHPGRFWGQRRSELAPITMIITKIARRPATLIRRTCIRFYERQLTGWFYESGKRTSRGKDKPGRRIHKRELAPGGDLSKLTAAYLAERAENLERPIRAQRRRWKGRDGGWSGYMNASTFERVAKWAVAESRAHAMAASVGRLESGSTGQGICSSQAAQEQQAAMAFTPAALARGDSAGRPYAMPASQRRPGVYLPHISGQSRPPLPVVRADPPG
jgi:hypothetical protein